MGTFNNEFKSKLKTYFINRLGAHDYKHEWMKMDCPYCNKEQKFGVNLTLNKTNCFVCGGHGQPINVIMDVEYINTFQEAQNFIHQLKSDYIYKEQKSEIKEKKEVYLPKGFHLITQGESQLAKSIRSYVKRRGFDIKEVSRRGWGYCTEDIYFGYLIIPFYERGKLIYFNARLCVGSGPRYNNPTTDITGIGKSFIWYNKDALYIYKTVFICEGAINAATMGDKAISSGGKFISRHQINDIIKSPVERVILLLDPDAIDNAIDLALKLINYKKIKLVQLPTGKDCNDLGKKGTFRYIYSTRYTSYNQLIQMKCLTNKQIKI